MFTYLTKYFGGHEFFVKMIKNTGADWQLDWQKQNKNFWWGLGKELKG